MYAALNTIFTMTGIFAIVLGLFLFARPKKSIQIQIAFYRLINWKIEPVSMEKEIKNTRIMGLVSLAIGILTIILLIF